MNSILLENNIYDDLYSSTSYDIIDSILEAVDVSDQFDVQFKEVDDSKETPKSDATGSNPGKQSWFKTLITKVKTFVKTAIGNIRVALNRIANSIRSKKATKMGEKVGKISTQDKEIYAKLSYKDMNLLDKGAKIGIVEGLINCIDTLYDLDSSKEANPIKSNAMTRIFPGRSTARDRKNNPKSEGTDKFYMKVSPVMGKRYLDNAVKYLNDLGNSANSVLAAMQRMANEGKSMQKIKTASIQAYNVVTAAIKEYYTAAMHCASYLIKNTEKSQEVGPDNGKRPTPHGAKDGNNDNTRRVSGQLPKYARSTYMD